MNEKKQMQKDMSSNSVTSVLQQQGWADKQDLIQTLHVSERTLQKWRSKGMLPFYRVGGKIYYKSSEVLEMIESCRCTGGKQQVLSSLLALVYMLLSNFDPELMAV